MMFMLLLKLVVVYIRAYDGKGMDGWVSSESQLEGN